MAKLPRKARTTDGIKWSCEPTARGFYLHAEHYLPGKVRGTLRQLRVWVPGSAVLDQAVRLIQGRINQQRYAALH